MAWVSTLGVVVPSPTSSLVFLAASRVSLTPILANGSLTSISLATVTPSCVLNGAPNIRDMTTFRPFGPSVTFTALAISSTPFLKCSLASVSKIICFAILLLRTLEYFSPPGRALLLGFFAVLAEDHGWEVLGEHFHLLNRLVISTHPTSESDGRQDFLWGLLGCNLFRSLGLPFCHV